LASTGQGSVDNETMCFVWTAPIACWTAYVSRHYQLGDVASWIEALATVGAAVLAGLALRAAGRAYRDQEKQLKMQREALDDQQKLNSAQSEVLALQSQDLAVSLAERRAAQAALVYTTARVDQHTSTTLDASGTRTVARYAWVLVSNASGQPIYDVRVRWTDARGVIQMHDAGSVLHPFSPTAEIKITVDASSIEPRMYDACFRDAGQRYWVIDSQGGREEVTRDQVEHLHLGGDVWMTPPYDPGIKK
jgi:hypothetical protein